MELPTPAATFTDSGFYLISPQDINGFSQIDTFITRSIPTKVDNEGIVYRSAEELLKLSFYDNAVYAIEKSYLINVPTEPKWGTTAEFAAQISGAFKLDGNWIKTGQLPSSFANRNPQPKLTIECQGFQVKVSFNNWDNQPNLTVIDKDALAKLKDRYLKNVEKAKEENKRRQQNVFKP